jgi:Zn-finger nucleic acid-binding protein
MENVGIFAAREETAMKCPVDGTTLALAERSGVEIDYCPECRGIWLDRGELDRILDHAGTTTRRDDRRDDHDRHHDDEHGRRDHDNHDRGRYGQPAKKRGGAFSALSGLLGGGED